MNRVLLLGIVRSEVRTFATKTGALQAEIDLETLEDEIDARSGEAFVRSQHHRLLFSGKLAASIATIAIPGRELSVEGKLTYWKSSGVIRVNSVKPAQNDGPNVTSKVLPSSHRVDAVFHNTPAFSSVATRG